MKLFFMIPLSWASLMAFGQYQNGDLGPAGGYIFYVDQDEQFEDWDYLEVWPFAISQFQLLACDSIPTMTSSDLGSGLLNTQAFVNDDETFNAFDFSDLFQGGGRTDWFVPSKDELDILNASTVATLINQGAGYDVAVSTAVEGCKWWSFSTTSGWNNQTESGSWVHILPIRSFKDESDGEACGPGTIWDEETQSCIVANPTDTNFDGCVQLTDLLDLLVTYGNCSNVDVWECGDPVGYQGYSYQTISIGDQCWFAENLRVDKLRNGQPIVYNASNSLWATAEFPCVAVYGETLDANCLEVSPTVNACDPAEALEEYGRLYNWYAVADPAGLCPSGWSVPSNDQMTVLELHLGLPVDDLVITEGYRGDDQGTQLKSTSGWYGDGNGTNESGFDGRAGGYRSFNGTIYQLAGNQGTFWTSTEVAGLPNQAWYRELNSGSEKIYIDHNLKNYGFSVRCVKN